IAQVSEAALVRFGVPVELAEHLRRTRCEQEIVPPYLVFDDGQHRPATVRVENIARREVDLARVIERASRQNLFRNTQRVECHHVVHLLPHRVNHGEPLACLEFECNAALRRNHLGHAALPRGLKGHSQGPSISRPLYCSASELWPWTASMGLADPFKATSRSM